jgi:hypothetical protein
MATLLLNILISVIGTITSRLIYKFFSLKNETEKEEANKDIILKRKRPSDYVNKFFDEVKYGKQDEVYRARKDKS